MSWFRKGANQGYAPAQYALGLMYSSGTVVSKNLIVAYALYNLAATKNSDAQVFAMKRRAALTDELSSKNIIVAQKLSFEMQKEGNLLKAMDKYLKNRNIKKRHI